MVKSREVGVAPVEALAFTGVGDTLGLVREEVWGEAVVDEEVEGQGEGVETPPEGVMLVVTEVEGEAAPESVASSMGVEVTNGEGEPLGASPVKEGQRDEDKVGLGEREVLADTVKAVVWVEPTPKEGVREAESVCD